MARQGTHLSGIDASEKQPRPGIPRQLQASVALWLVAVAAGLFETALVVVDATDGEVGSAAQLAAGVAVRLLVFTGTVYLATQLRQGRNWARVALAVVGYAALFGVGLRAPSTGLRRSNCSTPPPRLPAAGGPRMLEQPPAEPEPKIAPGGWR